MNQLAERILDDPAEPESATSSPRRGPSGQLAVTAIILFGPLVGVVVAATLLRDRVTILDLVLFFSLYLVTGHGITAGFHRLLAHRSFKAARWVKIALALAGSLAIEGSANAWVANHRLHHVYSDRDGDPHSPYAYGTSSWACVRGACHAHVGWLFQAGRAEVARWAPDLADDRDLVVVSRLFPLWCLCSLAIPTLIGWACTGTLAGAIGGLVWGGLVRVFVLQHATFAVNSACHLWGKRPFTTNDDDRARNLAPLALVTMGESWHNLHHSSPSLARHGVDPGQVDSTARLIWVLERAGLVWSVRWPDRARLDLRRRAAVPPRPRSTGGD